jgi:hypothetical protein
MVKVLCLYIHPVAGKEACAFKAWFEETHKELDMDVAVGLPAEPVWVEGSVVGSCKMVLDDGAHFTNLGGDDWVCWTYGSKLWKAACVRDPELAKLERLFGALERVGEGA